MTEKLPVLVVDDNAETCTLLTALLQRDFAVEIATDGNDAIEHLRTRRYSAILLDLRMPEYDGFTVLEFLQESQADVLARVIVMTALPLEREITRAQNFNICAVIPKPFDIEALLSAVKRCVARDSNSHGRGTGVFCSPVIFLLADLLRQRLM
jgi:DNA-binding response OmpR family regulator